MDKPYIEKKTIINNEGVSNHARQIKANGTDWMIMHYLVKLFFYTNARRIAIEDKTYVWVHIPSIITSIPAISITNREHMRRKLQKLKRLQLIDIVRAVDNTLYFRPTKLALLIIFEGEDIPLEPNTVICRYSIGDSIKAHRRNNIIQDLTYECKEDLTYECKEDLTYECKEDLTYECKEAQQYNNKNNINKKQQIEKQQSELKERNENAKHSLFSYKIKKQEEKGLQNIKTKELEERELNKNRENEERELNKNREDEERELNERNLNEVVNRENELKSIEIERENESIRNAVMSFSENSPPPQPKRAENIFTPSTAVARKPARRIPVTDDQNIVKWFAGQIKERFNILLPVFESKQYQAIKTTIEVLGGADEMKKFLTWCLDNWGKFAGDKDFWFLGNLPTPIVVFSKRFLEIAVAKYKKPKIHLIKGAKVL